MPEPRSLLERELARITPPPFTLDTFYARRARAERNRRIAGLITALVIAIAGLAVGLKVFTSMTSPVPASPVDVGAVASLNPSGVVVTTTSGQRTIVTPEDLAGTCLEGSRCGFMPMLSWSPDGGRLAFAFGDPETTPGAYAALYLVNADGSDARPVSDCAPDGRSPSACTELAWSPDGSRIAWVAMGHLWVVDLVTGEVRDLVGPSDCAGCSDQTTTASEIAWTPDGAQVAYVRGADEQIGVVAADGSSASVLVDRLPRRQRIGEPAWSPDGSSLLFASSPWHSKDSPALWVRGVATGTMSRVAQGQAPLRLQGGTWSPDGNFIAWRTGDLSIWVARSDGSQARPVYRVTSADDLGVFDGPWFAPDGGALLFQAPTANPRAPRTLVIPLDGGQPREVTGWSATWGQGSG